MRRPAGQGALGISTQNPFRAHFGVRFWTRFGVRFGVHFGVHFGIHFGIPEADPGGTPLDRQVNANVGKLRFSESARGGHFGIAFWDRFWDPFLSSVLVPIFASFLIENVNF